MAFIEDCQLESEILSKLVGIDCVKRIFHLFRIDADTIKLHSKNFSNIISTLKCIIEWEMSKQSALYDEEIVMKALQVNRELANYIIRTARTNKKQNDRDWQLAKLRENIAMVYSGFSGVTHEECALGLKNMEIGDIEIKLDSEDWEESLSLKSLITIPLSSVKFPFDFFKIDVSNYSWEYEGDVITAINIGIFNFDENDDDRIVISLGLRDEKNSNIICLKLKYSIEENIEKYDFNKENEEEIGYLFSRILSISMYLVNFKTDKKRVNESTRIIKKKKKKGITKDEKVKVLKLTQPKSEFKSFEYEESNQRGKINKSFFVRGHWRNQSYKNPNGEGRYNKLKFIDSYPKGKDREKLAKIINI